MRRRSTYVHDPTVDVNPSSIDINKQQLQLSNLNAAREERLTFGFDELPAELVEVLSNTHEIHIRWSPEGQYRTIAPFLSRIPPGLHVHYTPIQGRQKNSLICPLLHKIFSPTIKCQSPKTTFIKTPLISERFATSATLQYYSLLPSLKNLVEYIQRDLCQRSDLSCIHSASLLNIADSLDIDYDSISHVLIVSAFWSKPPAVFFDPVDDSTVYNAWNVDVKAASNSKIEVGILSASPATDAHDIQLSGFLTVVGEDDKAKPTLFSFPSRHHSLSSSQSQSQTYTVSFLQPQGLHPTLQISFPSAASLAPPTNRPEGSSCTLQTYLTLPSTIFMDDNVFLGNDPLFQSTHNIRKTISIVGSPDLEAPEYLIQKWGSTMLLEPAITTSSNKTTSDRSWNVTIPLHLRYLEPVAGGTVEAEMPWPIVYWACTAEEGTKFPVNPFDRINLGFEGLYGPRTMFYHLEPRPLTSIGNTGSGRLVEILTVPVYDTKVMSPFVVEMGTVVVILAGFAWVLLRLVPGLLPYVRGNTRQELMKKKQ